jgi:signal transduction histidine kinase
MAGALSGSAPSVKLTGEVGPLARRARLTTLIVVVAGLAATALIAFLPQLRFAYHAPSAHVAIEIGGGLSALIAAFLVYGRLARTRSSADLVLCGGLIMLGLANIARAFAPSYGGDNDAVVWAPLIGSVLVAGGALATAALMPPLRLRRPERRLLYLAGLILAAVAALAVTSFFAGRTPTGIDPQLSPAASHPRLVGSVPLLSMLFVGVVLLGAAAMGFANRAQRTSDELMAWLAIAAGLASVGRLNYFLVPSFSSGWVLTGDLLRGAAFAAILIGALRQIALYQRDAMRAAVIDERQRIARDLHDGLAQDLAYLSLQGRRLGRDDEVGEIARTAQETLTEARAVIANLRLGAAPLPTAVANLARTLTARHGTRLELDVDETLDVGAGERDELLRMLSEAISNAVRHGRAAEVRVSLRRRGEAGLVMSISDDGIGFDPQLVAELQCGTGLEGMRTRIERLGGSLHVHSRPGIGTTLEIALDEPRGGTDDPALPAMPGSVGNGATVGLPVPRNPSVRPRRSRRGRRPGLHRRSVT